MRTRVRQTQAGRERERKRHKAEREPEASEAKKINRSEQDASCRIAEHEFTISKVAARSQQMFVR